MTSRPGQQQLLLLNNHQIECAYADACGNTFLIFDCLNNEFTDQEWEAVKERIWTLLSLAQVDDALVLRKVEKNNDAIKLKMHVLEPDRTEADFCGNGARAVGLYLHRKYRAVHHVLVSRFGEHEFKYGNDGSLVRMGTPLLNSEELLFNFNQSSYTFRFVDCVEPHLVTDDFFDAQLLSEIGQQINSRWKERFPRGINVNCFRHIDQHRLEVLTYERGIYAITKACGTGSLACTKVAIDKKLILSDSTVTIQVLGGQLKINQCNDVFWLGGPVILKPKNFFVF